jgi:hypothetical protein
MVDQVGIEQVLFSQQMALLRSWVQIISSGPFLFVVQLHYCIEFNLDNSQTKPMPWIIRLKEMMMNEILRLYCVW